MEKNHLKKQTTQGPWNFETIEIINNIIISGMINPYELNMICSINAEARKKIIKISMHDQWQPYWPKTQSDTPSLSLAGMEPALTTLEW